MTLLEVWAVLLRACGVGVLLAGLGHALLPWALGWSADTGRDAGAMTALVIRMHVGFLGAFLIIVGLVSAVGATELVAGGWVGVCLTGGLAALFAARWVCELVLVPRALRAGGASAPWWWLHRFAAVLAWPGLVVSYGGAAILGLLSPA